MAYGYLLNVSTKKLILLIAKESDLYIDWLIASLLIAKAHKVQYNLNNTSSLPIIYYIIHFTKTSSV